MNRGKKYFYQGCALIIIMLVVIFYGYVGRAFSAVSPRTEKICTLCHNMDTIKVFVKTPEEWEVILGRMKVFGAPIEDGEIEEVASELAKEFTIGLGVMDANLSFIPKGAHFQSIYPFKLYIPNEADDTISVIDPQNSKVTAVITRLRAPHTSIMTHDGRFALVTKSRLLSNFLAVVDTGTDRIIGEIRVGRTPKHVELSRDGRFAYVANQGDNTISIVDIEQRKEVETIEVGKWPYVAKIDRKEQFIWVTNTYENTVSIIDAKKKTVVGVIEVGLQPMGLAFSKDKKYAFVSNSGSGTVSVINLEQRKVIKNISVGNRPIDIEVSKWSRKAYVAVAGEGNVKVIDPVSLKVIGIINLGEERGAHGILLNPTGRYAYVTNQDSNSVSLLQLEYTGGGGQVVTTIPVGRFPGCI